MDTFLAEYEMQYRENDVKVAMRMVISHPYAYPDDLKATGTKYMLAPIMDVIIVEAADHSVSAFVIFK